MYSCFLMCTQAIGGTRTCVWPMAHAVSRPCLGGLTWSSRCRSCQELRHQQLYRPLSRTGMSPIWNISYVILTNPLQFAVAPIARARDNKACKDLMSDDRVKKRLMNGQIKFMGFLGEFCFVALYLESECFINTLSCSNPN